MKRIRTPFSIAGIGALALGLLAWPARADVVIYQGQTSKASGLQLLSWGSGEASDSQEHVFTGIHSIKLKTQGRYQGVRMVLGTPADVKSAAENPNSYLELAVMIPDRNTTGAMGRGGMMGPGSGGMMGPGGGRGGMMGPGGGRGGMMGPGGGRGGMMGPGGGRGGMMGPGGSSGMGGMGGSGGMTSPGGSGSRSGQRGGSRGSGGMIGPGGSGGDTGGGTMGPGGGAMGSGGGAGMGGGGDIQQSLLTEPKPIRNVRCVLVMTDGKQVDVTLPLEFSRSSREGWRTLAVPFASLPAVKSASGQIAEIRVFGDSVGTMYIGQVRTVDDQTPIRVEDLSDRTVAVNDKVTFTGSADGGVSQLKYEWTVLKAGEKLDPLPADAQGRTFEHKFRKGGDYEVYLTVRDVYGLKKPVTTVAKVHVTL